MIGLTACEESDVHLVMAQRAVLCAPFCGPSPQSNRWSEIALTKRDGTPLNVDGEGVALAIRNGWLTWEVLDEPGHVVDDSDGPWEMMWRYCAVPAYRTIMFGRQMRGDI